MEDTEGNKERNVVKVLAKRPSQSTEAEVCKPIVTVHSRDSFDFDISGLEKYFEYICLNV